MDATTARTKRSAAYRRHCCAPLRTLTPIGVLRPVLVLQTGTPSTGGVHQDALVTLIGPTRSEALSEPWTVKPKLTCGDKGADQPLGVGGISCMSTGPKG